MRLIVAGLAGLVGLVLLLSAAHSTTGGMVLLFILAGCCFLFAVQAVRGFLGTRKNVAEGVIAAFGNLRLTPTELIEGYKASARRHPLAGLTAHVETTGNVTTNVSGYVGPYGGNVGSTKSDDRVVHVTIEGPCTAIVYSVKLKDSPKADTEARKFATRLNLASRQVQEGQPPSAGTVTTPLLPSGRGNYTTTRVHPVSSPPPPPPSVPAGWYPDPNNGQLQRYWDGTTWTEHTAPRANSGEPPHTATSSRI